MKQSFNDEYYTPNKSKNISLIATSPSTFPNSFTSIQLKNNPQVFDHVKMAYSNFEETQRQQNSIDKYQYLKLMQNLILFESKHDQVYRQIKKRKEKLISDIKNKISSQLKQIELHKKIIYEKISQKKRQQQKYKKINSKKKSLTLQKLDKYKNIIKQKQMLINFQIKNRLEMMRYNNLPKARSFYKYEVPPPIFFQKPQIRANHIVPNYNQFQQQSFNHQRQYRNGQSNSYLHHQSTNAPNSLDANSVQREIIHFIINEQEVSKNNSNIKSVLVDEIAGKSLNGQINNKKSGNWQKDGQQSEIIQMLQSSKIMKSKNSNKSKNSSSFIEGDDKNIARTAKKVNMFENQTNLIQKKHPLFNSSDIEKQSVKDQNQIRNIKNSLEKKTSNNNKLGLETSNNNKLGQSQKISHYNPMPNSTNILKKSVKKSIENKKQENSLQNSQININLQDSSGQNLNKFQKIHIQQQEEEEDNYDLEIFSLSPTSKFSREGLKSMLKPKQNSSLIKPDQSQIKLTKSKIQPLHKQQLIISCVSSQYEDFEDIALNTESRISSDKRITKSSEYKELGLDQDFDGVNSQLRMTTSGRILQKSTRGSMIKKQIKGIKQEEQEQDIISIPSSNNKASKNKKNT